MDLTRIPVPESSPPPAIHNSASASQLTFTPSQSLTSIPIWARRERMMVRHRTLTLDTSTPPEGGSFEGEQLADTPTSLVPRKSNPGVDRLRQPLSANYHRSAPGTPPPISQSATATPFPPGTPGTPQLASHPLFPLSMDPRFLMPPVDTRLIAGESPPHRKVMKVRVRYLFTCTALFRNLFTFPDPLSRQKY